jgi:hypothetical protein
MAFLASQEAAHRRLSGRTITVGLIVLVMIGFAGIWISHALIGQIYRGELFPGLLENRATKPLDYYYGVVDRLVLASVFLVALIASSLWARALSRHGVMLAVLLVGDLVYCIISERYGGLLDVRLDHGIPEFYQYFKEALIAWLLFKTFRATQRRMFAGWGALYTFVLLDDSLQYHERAGAVLGYLPGMSSLAATLGVRPADLGEILAVAPLLAALFLFLVWPFFRERPDIRRVAVTFGCLFVLLIFAGGVMDLVDRIASTAGSGMVQLLSLLEDGGEMVVMSLTCVYAGKVARIYGGASQAIR